MLSARHCRTFAVLFVIVLTSRAHAQDLAQNVQAQLSSLVVSYKDLHAHPELSHHKERTSALFAAELRKAGYTVTDHVGKYPDGSHAYGVVAILKNGPGPHTSRFDADPEPTLGAGVTAMTSAAIALLQ